MIDSDLVRSIKSVARKTTSPDNTQYDSISIMEIDSIAASTSYSRLDIEIHALKINIIPQRYARNRKSLSTEDQIRLLNSRVCIVGLGGLGGTVAEILARIGIGHMKLIDGDVFEESNLNRQLLCSSEVLGKSKAETAANHIKNINPSVETEYKNVFLNRENGASLLSGADIAVDCLDNLKTRFILEEISKLQKIPFVYGAVAGHSAQIMSVFPEDPGLARIYPKAEQLPEKGLEAQVGTLASAVSMAASIESAEVIKILLKKGAPLKDRLLLVDLSDMAFEIIDFSDKRQSSIQDG